MQEQSRLVSRSYTVMEAPMLSRVSTENPRVGGSTPSQATNLQAWPASRHPVDAPNPKAGHLILAALVALLAAPGQAQVEVTGTPSMPDATGAYTITLDIEDFMPVQVKRGQTWEVQYVYRLPGNLTIRKVRTFFGVDRGDAFEGHLHVLAGDFWLFTRGPHKEGLATYDAWAVEDVNFRTVPGGVDINVYALAYPTKGQPIGAHVGVILEVIPSLP